MSSKKIVIDRSIKCNVIKFKKHVPVIDHSDSVAIRNEYKQEDSFPEPEKRLKRTSKNDIVRIRSPSPNTYRFIMDRLQLYENHEDLEDGFETSFDYIEYIIDSLKQRREIHSMTLYGCEFFYDKVQNVALLCKYVARTGKRLNKPESIIGDKNNRTIWCSTAVKAVRRFLNLDGFASYTMIVPIGDFCNESLLFVQKNGIYGPLQDNEALYSYRHYVPCRKYLPIVMVFCRDLLANKKSVIDILGIVIAKNEGIPLRISVQNWTQIIYIMIGGWKPFGIPRTSCLEFDRHKRNFIYRD